MERAISKILLQRLQKWRVVALLGARQVGKSYLLKEILKHHSGSLVTLDDPLERKEAALDPLRYLEQRYQPGKYLFIDEAARVPEIFSAVKILVDRYDPKPTGICLANSGNYLLLRRIKESLAGRVNLLPIYPLSWREFSGSNKQPGLSDLFHQKLPAIPSPSHALVSIGRLREERMLWGGFPLPALDPDTMARGPWGSDYLRTYILPLIVEQFNIRDVTAFEQAAQILLAQSGCFFNANKLGQLTGVSQPTAASYTHQLEAMMVIEVVRVFFRSSLKRLVKQPKIHAMDPLLLHQPLGSSFSIQALIDRGQIGALYESFIFSEIKKTLVNENLHAEVFTWRTQDKAEVDVVLATANEIIPMEIKWTNRPSSRDASGLHSFLDEYPECPRGFIIYPGDQIRKISEKIMAVPDWWLLGCG